MNVSSKKMLLSDPRLIRRLKVIKCAIAMSDREPLACRSTSCAKNKPKRWRLRRRDLNRRYSRRVRIGGPPRQYRRLQKFLHLPLEASATSNQMWSPSPNQSTRFVSNWTQMLRLRMKCWRKLEVSNRHLECHQVQQWFRIVVIVRTRSQPPSTSSTRRSRSSSLPMLTGWTDLWNLTVKWATIRLVVLFTITSLTSIFD